MNGHPVTSSARRINYCSADACINCCRSCTLQAFESIVLYVAQISVSVNVLIVRNITLPVLQFVGKCVQSFACSTDL